MVLKVRDNPTSPAASSIDVEATGTHILTSPSQTLGAKAAAALDKELMSSGAFSLDQLMELAGLSVSQAGMAAFDVLAAQIDFMPG